MAAPPAPAVKICCIKSVAEARTAIAHGAAALGLVSHMPSGPGVISESLIAEIAAPAGELRECFSQIAEIEQFDVSPSEGEFQRCAITPRDVAAR